MSLFRTFLPLSRTLKMLHVRFPHFLLSYFPPFYPYQGCNGALMTSRNLVDGET